MTCSGRCTDTPFLLLPRLLLRAVVEGVAFLSVAENTIRVLRNNRLGRTFTRVTAALSLTSLPPSLIFSFGGRGLFDRLAFHFTPFRFTVFSVSGQFLV